MGIDVYWKNESGAILAEVADEAFVFADICELMFTTPGCCLRFVDPAGDTCFNQQQLPNLANELRALYERTPAASRAHVAAVQSLVQAANRTHTYVWFVGD